MTRAQTKELIRYRIEQATESIREGEILAREGLWHGVINRAYYAMFYATLALTVLRSETISKHTLSDAKSFVEAEDNFLKISPSGLDESAE